MQPSGAPAATIRPAAPADLPALGRLGALLVRVHHEFDPERFIAPAPQTEHAYASFLMSQLEEPDVVILVAERGGEVLGYTCAGVEGNDYMALRGPSGVLYDIVVDPGHRAHGLGWMLLDATLAALRARGAPACGALDSGAERVRPAPLRPRRLPPHDGRDDARAGRGDVVSLRALWDHSIVVLPSGRV